MQAPNAFELLTGPPRLIERPRLTRLLDGAEAPVILLTAPAGYGKTTLAREWLDRDDRAHGWYRGTGAMADVAALALGLAESAAAVRPEANARMRERLRAARSPEREVQSLAELLAEDLAAWPDEAWLVIDDYHFAFGASASERFVELLVSLSPLRLLITSRERPTWATPRRILYGEIFEIGQSALAMSNEEAHELFRRANAHPKPGLLALADGWPAVIGLAALTGDLDLPETEMPTTLHDYLAEELYSHAPPDLRWALCQAAVVPQLTRDLAERLFGDDTDAILSAGVRLGFFIREPGEALEMHPLVRRFLESRFRRFPTRAQTPVVLKLGHLLLDRCAYDDVFALVVRYPNTDLFLTLLERSYPLILDDSRLSTLSTYISFADKQHIASPALDTVKAELAFRSGRMQEAHLLAMNATKVTPATVRFCQEPSFLQELQLYSSDARHSL